MKWFLLMLLTFMLACGESSLDEGELIANDGQSGGETPVDPVYGDINGTITDARTGNAIANATVSISGTSHTTTTDASGNYSFSNVVVGTRSFVVSEASYMSQTISYELAEGPDNKLNISLLTTAYATNRIAIILTWDDSPADLDSHLYAPMDATTTSHVYYFTPGDVNGGDDPTKLDTAPFAALDVDKQDGNGPETITIDYTGGVPKYSPRTYRYFIHNYSNATDSIGNSNATVRVYKNGILTNTFNIDTSQTTTHWHVFDIDSAGNVQAPLTNEYLNANPAILYQ